MGSHSVGLAQALFEHRDLGLQVARISLRQHPTGESPCTEVLLEIRHDDAGELGGADPLLANPARLWVLA
jgi:hypothetical protein